MAAITFNCPTCNAPIDYTGRTEMMIKCGHCNNVVFVPEEARQAARTAASAPPIIPTAPVYYATSTYPATTAMKAGAAITIGSMAFVVLMTVGIGICVAGFVGAFFFLFRSHSVYTQAVALAKNDPAVIELFGSPVSDGFFVAGETSEGVGSGRASLSTSISGPKGGGQMNITGSKEGNEWRVDSINIYVDGRRVLFYDSDESEKGFQRVE